MKWYSLFSHTGKETETVSEIIPLESCFTNNFDYRGALRPFIASSMEIHSMLMCRDYVEDGSVVTLNGYMRIIPEEVLRQLCNRGVKVYNIHPALINKYPELRGKDPQERTFDGVKVGMYDRVGIVIHEVDAGIDTGRIILEESVPAYTVQSKSDLYRVLRALGIYAWLEFFYGEMYLHG